MGLSVALVCQWQELLEHNLQIFLIKATKNWPRQVFLSVVLYEAIKIRFINSLRIFGGRRQPVLAVIDLLERVSQSFNSLIRFINAVAVLIQYKR